MVFAELPSLIPRVSGLGEKYAVVWQGMRLCEGRCESSKETLFFSLQLKM